MKRPKTRHERAGRDVRWGAMRRYQIDFLLRHGLKTSDTYLDMGCGPLRGGIPVIEYLDAGNYTGVDAWADSLAEAWLELGEMGMVGKAPTLIEMDVTEPQDLERKFDVIMAFSVLHHIGDDGIDGFVEFVQQHLADGGVCYCTALMDEGRRGWALADWFHYPMRDRLLEDYQAAFEKIGLSLRHEEIVPGLHSEPIMSAVRREGKAK